MKGIHEIALFSAGLLITLGVCAANAANHYVRAGASGNGSGSDWINAYTVLPATLIRGDIYYIAGGTYTGQAFDAAESGTTVITIKKATASDHGTDTGWLSAYGGQAVFTGELAFNSSYWIFDGNGTHTVPSNNTNDYGFKISMSVTDDYSGLVSIGNTRAVSNITVRYLHIFNAYDSCSPPTQPISNGVRGIRLHPSYTQSNIKFQQIFLQNTGSDGIQLNNSNQVLIERSYLRRLGQKLPCSPDMHGQAIQMYGTQTMTVIRWNVIDASEGQAMLEMAYGDPISVRFYGNIVMNPYNTAVSGGYNSSGGVFGNSTSGHVTHSAIYNNTYVNLNDNYTFSGSGGTSSNYIIYSNVSFDTTYSHNNLWFNSNSSSWSIQQPAGNSHHAYGGLGTVDGANVQSGLAGSIFANYTGNDFRLTSATDPGLILTGQSWWNAAADPFFGKIDDNTDMYGNVRGADGTWDRGAVEFVSGGTVLNAAPAKPQGLVLR